MAWISRALLGAVVGLALAAVLVPGAARAQFDPTFDAHKVMQEEAQARAEKRAGAEAAAARGGGQAVVETPLYEPSYGEWLDASGAARGRMIQWMGGVYSGLVWANAEVTGRGQPPLVCPPPQVKMTGQRVMGLMTAQLGAPGAVQPPRDQALGEVVVGALKAAFPCRP